MILLVISEVKKFGIVYLVHSFVHYMTYNWGKLYGIPISYTVIGSIALGMLILECYLRSRKK